MSAYYNEFDPFAAAWLRELIADGQIAPGDVDERDIREVQAADLTGYTQCHFFAGIGGWSLALRLAGWPDDRPVWTGSCPCQPFSAAGKRGGYADERDLWPAWFRLIAECRPPAVFGEQVAGKAGLLWLDLVYADLESRGYAVAASDLPAAGVGAPHLRQRLWFVADADGGDESEERTGDESGRKQSSRGRAAQRAGAGATSRNGDGVVADAHGQERALHLPERGQDEAVPATGRPGAVGELADAESERPSGGKDAGRTGSAGEPERYIRGESGGFEQVGELADGLGAGLEGHAGDERDGHKPGRHDTDTARPVAEGHWADLLWLPCRDGRARPTQPGLQPLAHGVSHRVGTLRGAGNAIVPQVGAAFVAAYLEAEQWVRD